MNDYGNTLRVCGGCSAWLLVVDTITPTIYCAKCYAKKTPFQKWADALKPGDTVFLQPGVALPNLGRSQYVILVRDGDVLDLQVLGCPNLKVRTTVAQTAQEDVTPWRSFALY